MMVIVGHCILIVSLFGGMHTQGSEKSGTVTVQEARLLVRAALSAQTKQLPGLTLWISPEDEAKPPKCLTFDVLWSNPGPGSVHVGFWSVDMRTGEVWEPVLCKRVTNASLKRLQQSFRKRHGVTEAEYRDALTRGPCCVPDPREIKLTCDGPFMPI